MERDFQGLAGQVMPDMPDAFVNQVSDRYIELYETITGEGFHKVDYSNVIDRIQKNVDSFLSEMK